MSVVLHATAGAQNDPRPESDVPLPPPATPVVEETVPPPPAPVYVPAPAPPVYTPGPRRRAYIPTRPAVVPQSAELWGAVPFMLGFGLTVLGTLSLMGATAFLVNQDLSGINGEGIVAIGAAYLVGAALAAGGAYLTLGGLAGEVRIRTHQPALAWLASIASLLGGGLAIAALSTYLVDDHFGDDSVAFTIAAAGPYLMSLMILIGLDQSGGTSVALCPLPLTGGGGLNVMGRF